MIYYLKIKYYNKFNYLSWRDKYHRESIENYDCSSNPKHYSTCICIILVDE